MPLNIKYCDYLQDALSTLLKENADVVIVSSVKITNIITTIPDFSSFISGDFYLNFVCDFVTNFDNNKEPGCFCSDHINILKYAYPDTTCDCIYLNTKYRQDFLCNVSKQVDITKMSLNEILDLLESRKMQFAS